MSETQAAPTNCSGIHDFHFCHSWPNIAAKTPALVSAFQPVEKEEGIGCFLKLMQMVYAISLPGNRIHHLDLNPVGQISVTYTVTPSFKGSCENIFLTDSTGQLRMRDSVTMEREKDGYWGRTHSVSHSYHV